jgi:hypothetical protein
LLRDRTGLRYPSELTDAEWELVQPFNNGVPLNHPQNRYPVARIADWSAIHFALFSSGGLFSWVANNVPEVAQQGWTTIILVDSIVGRGVVGDAFIGVIAGL